jgi:Epoxide hydrolase N terminus
MSRTVETAIEVRPFHVEFSQEEIDELRSRIAATRWPEKETVDDQTQGVPLATIQALVRYWGTEYEFGRVEARLNAFPQFMAEIDGLDIHLFRSNRRTRTRCR